MGGGVPGQDWAFSSPTLRAWGECAFECVCWESVPVRERTRVCVCVCVCTPKGRHVTRNMSENTGVSVGGTAFAFFFNQKLNIFLFVFFSSLFLDCECCEFLFWFLYSLLKNH